jgi:transcriptional regulator with XRE-family HTH domain/KaiC/GvpD/RAD55 family RecA-like ATPase
MTKRMRVASGVSQLDRLLGGLYIGDNVVWHDDAGSLASVFCLNFIQTSLTQKKPFIYVSFDRSPRNLLEKLGPLSEYPSLTILDCFTHGKGAGSGVFLKFYEQDSSSLPCGIIQVDKPHLVENVMDAFYGVHGTMEGDVRFVFESLTGMQELWGGEEDLLKFYTHSCPRLYELNTIAYWIIEKEAHSPRLRAQINQIAQVAIDLSVRRGTTSLTVLKAENRDLDTLNQPFHYSSKHLNITFDTQKRSTGRIDLGMRLKELRTKRGLSQTELAKRVGVTPSTISQVESNSIYPSLPALLKMAEILAVEVNSFFQGSEELTNRVVFPVGERVEVRFPDLPTGSIKARLLTPLDFDLKAESYFIEIPGKKSLPSHFFIHKGEEMGYLLSGELRLKFQKGINTIQEGDVVYLTTETPIQWTNPGPSTAQLLWIKIR